MFMETMASYFTTLDVFTITELAPHKRKTSWRRK